MMVFEGALDRTFRVRDRHGHTLTGGGPVLAEHGKFEGVEVRPPVSARQRIAALIAGRQRLHSGALRGHCTNVKVAG